MEEKENTINYIAYESTVSMMERTIRRLWIMCILLVVLLVATNAGWLIYNSQFEYFTETTTVEQSAETGDGGDVILNGTGEVTINGER